MPRQILRGSQVIHSLNPFLYKVRGNPGSSKWVEGQDLGVCVCGGVSNGGAFWLNLLWGHWIFIFHVKCNPLTKLIGNLD